MWRPLVLLLVVVVLLLVLVLVLLLPLLLLMLLLLLVNGCWLLFVSVVVDVVVVDGVVGVVDVVVCWWG